MFNLSGSEIIVILLLALVVLGPEKLPDALRRAGRTYSELKKMGNSFQAEMKSVLDEPMREMRETADLLKQSVDFTDGELTGKRTPTRATAPSASTGVAGAPSTGSADAPVADHATEPAADASSRAGSTTDIAPSAGPPPASAEDELINRTLSGEQ